MSGIGDGNSTELPTEICSDPFSSKTFSIVAALAAASGFVSFLASCFAVFVIILFRKWKFFSQRLVFYLAISTVLASFSVVIARTDYDNQPSASDNHFCKFAAFFSQVASWMVLNSFAFITISLFVRAFFNKNLDKFEIVLALLIFLFPLLLNWIPFIEDTYGRAGPWCWIRTKDAVTCDNHELGRILQIVLWYMPLYVTMFITLILYILVLIKLEYNRRKWTSTLDPQAQKNHEKALKNEVLSLLAYPVIFFASNVLLLIVRIHALVEPLNPEPALWFIGALTPLSGGLVAIVIVFDKETRKNFKWANLKTAILSFGRKRGDIKEYNISGLGREKSIKLSHQLE